MFRRFVDITALSRNVNLRRHEVCDALIDCFCELLDLSYASHNFRSWPEAVKFYSTMHHPDAYKCSLRDEFVLTEHEVLLRAKEHDSILSDLLVSFRAVVTYMLVSAGIIQALSRFILRDLDDPTSLRATLLMSDLMLMGSTYLPTEWKLRVLSVPTLVHSACEVMSGEFGPKNDPGCNEGDRGAAFTYFDARNAPLLLHRLNTLNDITMTQKTQPVPVTNLELFVPSSPDSVRWHISKLSAPNFDVDADVEAKLNELLMKTVGSDGQFRWDAIDVLLRFLELRANFSKDTSSKYPEKCYVIFKQLFAFITPTEGLLITRFDGDRFTIACCCRAVHVALLFSRKDTLYKELLLNFIDDFIKNISKDVLDRGPLSPKNLLNSGAAYYFAFIGAISASVEGRKMLEATPLLQLLVLCGYFSQTSLLFLFSCAFLTGMTQ
ncbi:unnamed protein product [Gongylonema pulchrum]|uniref:RICTOR_N domain-containing protein n=1 Tax=Gongylonema pulchrum TaxID=637853 RepID=A0A183E105_9BILA|nr:unnamed protein product [Gongylonema pulchrum]